MYKYHQSQGLAFGIEDEQLGDKRNEATRALVGRWARDEGVTSRAVPELEHIIMKELFRARKGKVCLR